MGNTCLLPGLTPQAIESVWKFNNFSPAKVQARAGFEFVGRDFNPPGTSPFSTVTSGSPQFVHSEEADSSCAAGGFGCRV
jgi:hypothetical protein